MKNLLERVVDIFPVETLSENVETSARNNSSVITLLNIEGRRILLTGDAGIPALSNAADYYESLIGSFYENPLSLFQAPHHGSRRNLGPEILDRILGPKNYGHSTIPSIISSAKAAPKHPSPKVINALGRRGCKVSATEGNTVSYGYKAPSRAGWVPLTPYPPLEEGQDEDE